MAFNGEMCNAIYDDLFTVGKGAQTYVTAYVHFTPKTICNSNHILLSTSFANFYKYKSQREEAKKISRSLELSWFSTTLTNIDIYRFLLLTPTKMHD